MANFIQGGPLLIKDSDIVVEEVLHKLGFRGTYLNSDLNEAIQVFSSMTLNKRSLRKTGVKSADLESCSSSLSALRYALLSNESHLENFVIMMYVPFPLPSDYPPKESR